MIISNLVGGMVGVVQVRATIPSLGKAQAADRGFPYAAVWGIDGCDVSSYPRAQMGSCPPERSNSLPQDHRLSILEGAAIPRVVVALP